MPPEGLPRGHAGLMPMTERWQACRDVRDPATFTVRFLREVIDSAVLTPEIRFE